MVEGTGLENRRAVKRTQGSNPCLSAIEIPRPFGRGISMMRALSDENPSFAQQKGFGAVSKI